MELCFAGSVYSLLLHAYFGYGIQLYFLFIVHVSIAVWIPSLYSPLSPTPTSFTPSHSRSLSLSLSIDRPTLFHPLSPYQDTYMYVHMYMYTIHFNTCTYMYRIVGGTLARLPGVTLAISYLTQRGTCAYRYIHAK